MTAKPRQPSHVKSVSKLQDVLDSLQKLQNQMSNEPQGLWGAEGIAGSLEQDLKQGDSNDSDNVKGICGGLAKGVGDKYADNVQYITKVNKDISSGLAWVISKLSTTIQQHSKTDTDVADGANQTNTTQQPTAATEH